MWTSRLGIKVGCSGKGQLLSPGKAWKTQGFSVASKSPVKSLHLSWAVLIWTVWNSSLSSSYLLIWPRVKIIWQEQHWGQVPPLMAFILSNYQEHHCTMERFLILISSLLISIFSPSSFVFQNPTHHYWKAGYWGKGTVLWAVGKCPPKATAFRLLFLTCIFGGSFCQPWSVYLCYWRGSKRE